MTESIIIIKNFLVWIFLLITEENEKVLLKCVFSVKMRNWGVFNDFGQVCLKINRKNNLKGKNSVVNTFKWV